MSVACLLPAAGASARMRGGDKLMETVNGAPCLRVMAERALAAGMSVIVTLPNHDHPRAKALDGLAVQKVSVPNAKLGMSASLKAGIDAICENTDGVMILPPDMPGITSADMAGMVAQFERTFPMILRARAKSGAFGHPIIFSTRLLPDFKNLSGDLGAKPIVQKHQHEQEAFDFADDRPLLDLDTPEDWRDWRASFGRE